MGSAVSWREVVPVSLIPAKTEVLVKRMSRLDRISACVDQGSSEISVKLLVMPADRIPALMEVNVSAILGPRPRIHAANVQPIIMGGIVKNRPSASPSDPSWLSHRWTPTLMTFLSYSLPTKRMLSLFTTTASRLEEGLTSWPYSLSTGFRHSLMVAPEQPSPWFE